MKYFLCGSLCVVLLCGCSSLASRKQERASTFAILTQAQREMVEHGRIERGMDTNAVYIALGQPSAVTTQPSATGTEVDQTWIYYGSRPVLVPAWVYLPDPYGYWTLEYQPEHHAERYVKAEVHFHGGRVLDWQTY